MGLIDEGKPEEAKALLAQVEAQASGDSDRLAAVHVFYALVYAELGDPRAARSAIQAPTPGRQVACA